MSLFSGFGKALLIALLASFGAPVLLCIAAGTQTVLQYGRLDLAALFVYGLAVFAFSMTITCAFTAVVVCILRIIGIRFYDGLAAIAVALAVVISDVFLMGVEHTFPWVALPVGANALAFFVLDRLFKNRDSKTNN